MALLTNKNDFERNGVLKNDKSVFNLRMEEFFQRKLLPFFIVFMGFVAMSPVLANFDWRGIYSLFIIIAVTALFVFLAKLQLHKWFVYSAVLMLLTSSMTGIYWGDARYLFANVFLIGAVFLIQFANYRIINKCIDIASVLMLLIVVGAVIGFVLAALGVPSILDFSNPDGRKNYFFYTTLSNFVRGDFIRPAGIYDEPGALSLYICAIAALRHLFGKDIRFTWVMLLLGFVTLSLAHLVYVFFHLLSETFTKKNLRSFAVLAVSVLVVVYLTGFGATLQDKMLQRLSFSEQTGTFKGDNRSFRMINAINLIDKNPTIGIFGADPSCRFNYEHCKTLFPPFGENPITPIFVNGLLVSWPFYLVLVLLFLSPVISRKYFVAFGMGLLFLQRPEVLGLSGAMLSALIVFCLVFLYKNASVKKLRRSCDE